MYTFDENESRRPSCPLADAEAVMEADRLLKEQEKIINIWENELDDT